MIKARANGVLVFGLSDLNLELLCAGRPISFDLAELGLPPQRVIIFHGRTEDVMEQYLRDAGLLPAAAAKAGKPS